MDDLYSLHPNGLFLRREALDHAYRDRDLRAAVRDGELTKVRHGAYVSAATWRRHDDVGKYRLKCQAVCLTHHHDVALSHTSGAAVLGMRMWGTQLERVHVVRLDSLTARRANDVVHHRGTWSPDDLVQVGEMLVLPPALCAVGHATLVGVESGVVTLDSLYHLGLGTQVEVEAAYRSMSGWPRTSRLQITVRLAELGSESVGESRGRYLFWSQHLPRPELQYRIYDHYGRLVGVTDYAWPDYGLLGEFDGKMKYGRSLRPGDDPAETVYREKRREDLLRELTQWSMVRITWPDLYDAATTAARIRRLMRRPASVA